MNIQNFTCSKRYAITAHIIKHIQGKLKLKKCVIKAAKEHILGDSCL